MGLKKRKKRNRLKEKIKALGKKVELMIQTERDLQRALKKISLVREKSIRGE
jgi:hypothetical protein